MLHGVGLSEDNMAKSQANLLKVKVLIADKEYESAIAESGFLLKEDENNLEALLLCGCAYYYLADHDIATRKAYFGLKNLQKKSKSVEDNPNKGKLCVVVEEFKASLAVDPIHLAHNVDLHFGLCKVLVKYGRGKDALDSCSEALKIDEELVEALVQAIVC
ncbi:hypothetical protein JHK84_043410 [Glycine max]|nr:hypothetical protein JHK86_043224 [Glycine max]KAG5117297.1 hypothetical protein JHK84_043410 [Glycine max]